DGQIQEIKADLKPGTPVRKGQELIRMHNSELAKQVQDLVNEINNETKTIGDLSSHSDPEKRRESVMARTRRDQRQRQLDDLRHRPNAILQRPGEFWVGAPMDGIILTADFRDLQNANVKANQPLMRVGKATDDIEDWEIELKIPQKHIGQVLAAYGYADVDEELDVDLLLQTHPTQTFKGKLHKNKIAKDATPNRNDNNEPEPVVIARVRLSGVRIDEADQIPDKWLLTGTEVHTRVRCGNHAMGYSLFYGVWEFIYEKIVFFF